MSHRAASSSGYAAAETEVLRAGWFVLACLRMAGRVGGVGAGVGANVDAKGVVADIEHRGIQGRGNGRACGRSQQREPLSCRCRIPARGRQKCAFLWARRGTYR